MRRNAAAARFIEKADPRNAYYVGDFNKKWRELTDWTQDSAALIAALRKAGTHTEADLKEGRSLGYTALHDACLATLEKLERAPHPKRVVFLITDGDADSGSTHKLSELRQQLRTSDVLFYVIGLNTGGQNSVYAPGAANLDDLTLMTGGRAYFIDIGAELAEVVDHLALELRSQYVVGFKPANTAPGGKWNKVKIKVEPTLKNFKKLWVRSREGYLSPASTHAP